MLVSHILNSHHLCFTGWMWWSILKYWNNNTRLILTTRLYTFTCVDGWRRWMNMYPKHETCYYIICFFHFPTWLYFKFALWRLAILDIHWTQKYFSSNHPIIILIFKFLVSENNIIYPFLKLCPLMVTYHGFLIGKIGFRGNISVMQKFHHMLFLKNRYYLNFKKKNVNQK